MNNRYFFRICMLYLFSITIVSCSDNEFREVVLYEPGVLDANASHTSIEQGETVNFIDQSTKVDYVEWNFPGGNPSFSGDKEVTVTYENSGNYVAELLVHYIDNQTDTTNFEIEVIGTAGEDDNDDYDFNEDDLIIYTGENLDNELAISVQTNNQFAFEEITTNVFAGNHSGAFEIDGSDSWAMASIKPSNGAIDISEFTYYNIALRSDSEGDLLFRLQSSGQQAIVTLNFNEENYGFVRDNQWHEISIPIADFVNANPDVDLSGITDLLVLRSTGQDVRNYNNYNFYIDNFYLSN